MSETRQCNVINVDYAASRIEPHLKCSPVFIDVFTAFALRQLPVKCMAASSVALVIFACCH